MNPLLTLLRLALASFVLSPLAPCQGFLGVRLEDEGSRIAQVVPGSAAEAGGLLAGDRIVRIAGRSVESFEDLAEVVREHDPGDPVWIVVLRGEERVRVRVTLGEPPGDTEEMEETEEAEETEEPEAIEDVEEADVGGRDAERKAWFGITIGGTEGEALRVDSVSEGSPAEKAGVRAGDRIVTAGDRPGSELAAVVGEMSPGEPLAVKVIRDGEDHRFTVVLGARAAAGGGAARVRAGEEGGVVVLRPDGRQVQVVPRLRRAPTPPGAEGEEGPSIELDVVPEVRGRVVRPRAQARFSESIGPEEIRALREEVRALREEVRSLRRLIQRQQGGGGSGAFDFEFETPLLWHAGALGTLEGLPLLGFEGGMGEEEDDCCCDECGCECDHEAEEIEEGEAEDDCCCDECGLEACEGHETGDEAAAAVPY